jgi:hypothetical protein
MDPQPISIIDSPNTYLERLGRLFFGANGVNYYGLLMVIVPLIVLAGIFFIIRHYSSSKRIVGIYGVVAAVAYLAYLFILLPSFSYVI